MKNILNSTILLFLFSIIFSCGKNDVLIKDAKVETYASADNHIMAKVRTIFDFGKAQVPSLTLPLSYRGTNYGTFSVLPRLDGRSDIIIDLDLSESFSLPSANPKLPNGYALPLADLAYADQLVEIPVDKIKGSVYLAAVNGRIVIGFATVLKGLDGLAGRVGEINFFPRFEFGRFQGIAGIFTSNDIEQSGLACFVAVDNIFPEQVRMMQSMNFATYSDFTDVKAIVDVSQRKIDEMRAYDRRLTVGVDQSKKVKRKVQKHISSKYLKKGSRLDFVVLQH